MIYETEVCKYNLEILHVQDAHEIKEELLRIGDYLEEILFSCSSPFWLCLALLESQLHPPPNQS